MGFQADCNALTHALGNSFSDSKRNPVPYSHRLPVG